ncbi:MAG: hypothetical protein PHW93_01995 [Candidatus Methanomethylophilaceae archaeon]|nr:hypothetical protein [Candidatus Methanomethylophilaceae archaeon]
MPELPEVEAFRRRIMDGAMGKQIQSARLDGIRVLPESVPDVEASLHGRRVVGSERNGKSLFLALDDGRWLLLHFGMSGEPVFFHDQEPRFTRLAMTFPDCKLAICWQRKLGAVAVLEDFRAYLSAKKRGPDALEAPWDAFREGFHGRRAVKSLLLDQSFVSGVGNLYADEMLYQNGILPQRPASSISEDEVKGLYDSMGSILRLSIQMGTDFSRFPSGMMLNVRHRGSSCPRCRSPWSTSKVGGRTSFFCQHCQR